MAKILVVDDEQIFIVMMKKILSRDGYEVVSACDGLEGLEKVNSENPDLVILDVIMPRMDGYTMLKKVRENEQFRDLPVILCTGKAQGDYIKMSQGIGVNAYFTKPIDPPLLLAEIKQLLYKR